MFICQDILLGLMSKKLRGQWLYLLVVMIALFKKLILIQAKAALRRYNCLIFQRPDQEAVLYEQKKYLLGLIRNVL